MYPETIMSKCAWWGSPRWELNCCSKLSSSSLRNHEMRNHATELRPQTDFISFAANNFCPLYTSIFWSHYSSISKILNIWKKVLFNWWTFYSFTISCPKWPDMLSAVNQLSKLWSVHPLRKSKPSYAITILVISINKQGKVSIPNPKSRTTSRSPIHELPAAWPLTLEQTPKADSFSTESNRNSLDYSPISS